MRRTSDCQRAVAEALGRAAICRTLACALDYPAPERRADVQARWEVLLGGAAGWPSGLREAAATAAARFDETAAEALEAAHVRLFGPAGRAPMVESAWCDAGRLLGRSAALADLGGFYRAFAVAPAVTHPRPEDHLGLELEFLSVLAIKEAWAITEDLPDALAVTREATAAFLRDHLGTWVHAWRDAVAVNDPPAAYATLAEAVDAFVLAECARAGVAPRRQAARGLDHDAAGDCFTCPRATEA